MTPSTSTSTSTSTSHSRHRRRRRWATPSFNIDRYLNRLVPAPPWNHLPRPLAHFLGHRGSNVKPADLGNLRPIFWAFIGIFCSIALIQVVAQRVPAFEERDAPLIIGSFGAAAVLEFYAIESPLAQPRNAVFGQVLSTVVGVAIAKLFQLSPHFESVRWAAGALACAAATAVMALTKTVHPPAGATALLAVANPIITKLGWYLIPVMLLGLALMLAVALIINNIERQFPIYWWTPEDLRRNKGEPAEDVLQHKHTPEDGDTEETDSTLDLEAGGSQGEQRSQYQRDPSPAMTATTAAVADKNEIIIRPGHVHVPEHLFLRQEEVQFLETLSQRL
jgi:hypothetical protein